jgi:chromosome partitioning protein
MATQRILVCNAKGGCGKTTIATNIASYYASEGKVVRLFDYDNQGSAQHWLKRRPPELKAIDVVDASRRPDNHMTRSWQMRVPAQTDLVVIDTPAGIGAADLASMLQENDNLIIPVLPSPIDIHATAYFIKDVLLIGKARKKQVRIAVVANRVRKNTLMYHALERFLFTLNLPFVSSFRDTQFYTKAIEQGIGIMDIRLSKTRVDHEQWAPLIRWMNTSPQPSQGDVRPLFNQKVSS